MRRAALIPAWALALVVLAGLAGGTAGAAFLATSSNSASTFAAETDTTAPTISRAVLKKASGYSGSYLKQGGTYNVYAQVSDGWTVGSVSANVAVAGTVITTGQTNVAMTAGSYSVEGQTYNYRTTLLTADAVLTAGSKTFRVTASDTTSHSGTSNFTATVDNTAPTASDVQAVNSTGTVGRADIGDTVTYTFSEPMDPDSLVSGWTGTAATNVVVRVENHQDCAGSAPRDRVRIYNAANTTFLFGCVYTNANLSAADLYFGATGTPSTMTMSGSTVTVALGTLSGPGSQQTNGTNRTLAWTPVSSPFDRAANALSTTVANESGAADVDF